MAHAPKPRITLVFAAIFLAVAFPAFSQDPPTPSSRAAAVLDSMPHTKRIGDLALSPDGTRVAYLANEKLHILSLAGGPTQEIALKNNLSPRDLTWSPDSKLLAFLADLPTDVPSAQICTVSPDGSALTQHAEFKGYVQSPRFSPDGSKLAFLFVENMPRVAGPLQPMTALAGVVNDKIFEQRIATLDLSTDRVSQLTPADMYVYEFDWTPDGKSWVATAAHGVGDDNWYIARLDRFDAQSGECHELYKPKLQIAEPRVSPDGKSVAFIEGLMSDEGSTGGDIYVVPIEGGTPRDLTPNIKSSPSALAWTSPNQITFTEIVDGDSGFAMVSIDGGAPQSLWTGSEVARPTSDSWAVRSSSAKPIVAIVRQSPSMPPEAWAGPVGNWKQLTQLNAGIQPAWGQSKKVHWMNGSTRIQGWLLFPKDYSPQKTYPLIVAVHGGPSAACLPYWDGRFQGAFSAMGYFTLCPNPRGSYGQGEAFTKGNVKDFGGGDFRDIMAGVDSLLKLFPIDPNRLGIWGHSYGGYMTMWAETQTHRFAAAVAGAGLSDWLSYYGVNDLDQWMIPFFGASIYDNPAIYAKSDPIRFVKSVKTPTLILVGDRDGEVPMEQSVEWWHALETFHVPTKLVVYPDEGHVFVKPADSRDYILRALAWFDEWFAKAPTTHHATSTAHTQPATSPTGQR